MTMQARATELQTIARQMQQGLAQLGLCHQVAKLGVTMGISFRGLELVESDDGATVDWGLLEVDALSLPPRVNVTKLTRDDTLHHLQALVGRPVFHANSLGLTYIVDLRSSHARRVRRRLPDRVDLDLTRLPKGMYMVPIGVSTNGPVWRSLPDLGHILLGGATRMGKSVWLQSVLASLLTRYHPRQLRLVLVDCKMVEFSLWAGLPHLMCPIATDVEDVHRATGVLMDEMNRRQTLFAEAQARNLAAYNAQADRPEPVILAVFDELADITLALGKSSQAYSDLVRLVQKGIGLGIYIIAATQNPKAEVLGTLARGQFTTRLALRVNESYQSRVILERDGAEKLPGTKGRLLARLPESTRLAVIQGYYLDDDELLAVTRRLATGKRMTWNEIRQSNAPNAADLRAALQDLDESAEPEPEEQIDEIELRHRYRQGNNEQKRSIVHWLLDLGKTQTEIEEILHGYTGGAAHRAVRALL